MKRLLIIVIYLCFVTPAYSVVVQRPATDFPIITPATDDYFILTDTSNTGRFSRVATSNMRVAIGFPTCSNDQDLWEWDVTTSKPICVTPTDVTAGSGIDITTGAISSVMKTASKAAAYTIGTDDADEAYGGTIYVTSAATITAPAVTAGMNFTVVTIGAIAVSLDVNASDRMYLDGTALADGDKATNTSTTGDTITCAYESSAGWFCWSGSPDGDHWTDGN